MLIRTATEADWPALRPIYREVAEAGETYALPTPGDDAVDHAHWMASADATVYVAVGDDGRLLGTAKVGPNRPGRGAHVATASFMVASAARGLGVGRALAEHVLQVARAEGYAAMQFNAVVETNTAAVRLWEALGFVIVGTVPEAFDHPQHGLVGLHVMYLRLDPRT